MDELFGYNQIQIQPKDQHKIAFVCPWGTFVYINMLFGLKNVGSTFQQVIHFSFNNIKHIIEAYLDDSVAPSVRDKTILITFSLCLKDVGTIRFGWMQINVSFVSSPDGS